MTLWSQIQYFKPREFVRPELLRDRMAYMLDELRSEFNAPIYITSSLRDPADNARVGGVKNSAHRQDPTDGMYSGIDFSTNNRGEDIGARDKYVLTALIFKVGFPRVGIYDDHFHVDIETRLDQDVMWLG